MTKRKFMVFIWVSRLFIASFPLAGFAQTTAQSHRAPTLIKVGILRDPAFLDQGGCYLQLPADYKKRNERYVFRSDYDDNAIINIDGKDTELKPVSHRESKGGPKKSDRSTGNYATKGTKVRVDFVVNGVCLHEECESVSYDATITVIRGPGKQVVKVKGSCGS